MIGNRRSFAPFTCPPDFDVSLPLSPNCSPTASAKHIPNHMRTLLHCLFRRNASVRHALLILLAALTLGACAEESPTGTNNNNNTSTGPGVGTSYTMQAVTTDASGRIVQSQEIISVIAETNQSYFGRTGLVKMITAGQVAYFSYTGTNDLSMFYRIIINGVPFDSSWVLYPFGSKGTSTYPALDHDVSGIHYSTSGTIAYTGSESVTIAGETFATERVTITSSAGMGPIGSALVLRTDRIDTMWYAPKVKYLVKQSGIQKQIFSGSTDTYYNVVTLKSYSLK